MGPGLPARRASRRADRARGGSTRPRIPAPRGAHHLRDPASGPDRPALRDRPRGPAGPRCRARRGQPRGLGRRGDQGACMAASRGRRGDPGGALQRGRPRRDRQLALHPSPRIRAAGTGRGAAGQLLRHRAGCRLSHGDGVPIRARSLRRARAGDRLDANARAPRGGGGAHAARARARRGRLRKRRKRDAGLEPVPLRQRGPLGAPAPPARRGVGLPGRHHDPRAQWHRDRRHRALRREGPGRQGSSDAAGGRAALTAHDPTPSVLVARRLLPAGRGRIATRCEIREGGLEATREDLIALAPGVAAIVADPSVPVDDELLEAAGKTLRVVANYAVGYDNVDLDACRRRGVAVTNTPGVLTNATAELALALTLAAARLISAAESELRAGRWSGWDPGDMLGLELSGATFGVVGMGRIGRRYAELVASFDGTIVYTSRSPNPDVDESLGASMVTLEELLAASDVVSLHVPASPETVGMISASELEAMRPHAVLVNNARGTLVDSEALARALADGTIGAAGLDVYEHEPEVPEDLLEAPRCVLLPHIGSATTKARDAMAALVADNLLAVLDGAEPPNRVA